MKAGEGTQADLKELDGTRDDNWPTNWWEPRVPKKEKKHQ